MNKNEEVFRGYIQSKGLTFTPEREAILNHISKISGHFEAIELLISMRENKKMASRSTIYRTLKLLVKSGVLREISFGEAYTHYEQVYGREYHEHLVCTKCGKTLEFTDKRIVKLRDNVCLKHQFKVVSYEFLIMGHCKECGYND